MARLLFDGEWFDAIDGRSWYEADFEAVVKAHAASLFPDSHVLPFKIAVETEHDRRIPDLAVIDAEYRDWSVVEVEMAHHSLNRHVLPQVEVFAQGAYGRGHVGYLMERSEQLDEAALADMIKGAQPRVIVVVNQETPDWTDPIRRAGGDVLVVEVFRSVRNRHSLRVLGTYPASRPAQLVTACRLDRLLPNMLVIDSPAALGVVHGQQLEIVFDGRLTEWERLDVADQVWLRPLRRNPLAVGQDYEIQKARDGRLAFQRAERHTRR